MLMISLTFNIGNDEEIKQNFDILQILVNDQY